MDKDELQVRIASLATKELVRSEGERLREHMTLLMERVRLDIHALIGAIELLKYIDSEARQHRTTAED
jgi:hypothetical protein